jgi:putative endonuclease
MRAVSVPRTSRRRSGDRAEAIAVAHLRRIGWTILERNVRAGADEIDLVAVDPGWADALVFVEVRSNGTGRFGAPEESVAGPKLRRTYRAAFALLRAGRLPNGVPLPRIPWRVDVIVVEQGPAIARDVGGPVVRHLRGVAPD